MVVATQSVRCDLTGRALGRWLIEAFLGAGRGSRAWGVRGAEDDSRGVLRVFATDGPAALVTRLTEGREILWRVDHPATTPVLDVGLLEGIGAYLVQPRLAGSSLRDRLQGGRLDPRQVATVLRRAASASSTWPKSSFAAGLPAPASWRSAGRQPVGSRRTPRHVKSSASSAAVTAPRLLRSAPARARRGSSR